MVSLHPRDVLRRSLNSEVFRYTIFLLTLSMAATAIIAAIFGVFRISGQLASLAAALATILLVSLTAQYAEQTQKLVEESKRDREQRKKERQQDREREVDSLRRALLEEIGKIEYFEDLIDDYHPGVSLFGIAAPSTIYESNAADIGLLTDREIDNVVEYYTRLERVSEAMEAQKQVDTTFGMGPIEELWARWERLPEVVLHRLSRGYLGSNVAETRTKDIQDRFRKLSEAQKRAIEALEENLEDEPRD